jgi:hypothetical protein
MAGSPLDPIWWKQNAPESIATGEIQKALADLTKLKSSMFKDLDPTAYLKGLEKLLKNALPKDERAAKKSKDKDSGRALALIKSAAEDQLKNLEKNAGTLVSAKSTGTLPKARAGVAVPTPSGVGAQAGAKSGGGSSGGQGVSLDSMVNLGKTAWEIVKEGSPTSAAKSAYCQAMPSKKQLPWEEISDWKTFSTEWERCWQTSFFKGLTPVPSGADSDIRVKLQLEFDWNGQSKKAAGLFLNNCSVWSKYSKSIKDWHLDVDATVQGNPKNIGSASKPVGAIQLRVTIQVRGPKQVVSEQFAITCGGDGSIRVS